MQLRARFKRALKAGPRVVALRLAQETLSRAEQWRAPRRASSLSQARLLGYFGSPDLADLWSELAARPYLTAVQSIGPDVLDELCPGDTAVILNLAERALRHEVDLLGSGPVQLGSVIDWHKDYKTGWTWPVTFFRDIEYANLDRPSDVKFPWELSRLQWLLPVGQAYLLTGNEEYATFVRQVLESWIAANPYSTGVNWRIAMEPAMRIFTWTWLFHVFKNSDAWSDTHFRFAFLRALYLHGDFTLRHIERSDINGNHCTADAAGLVAVGLFFGAGRGPVQWQTFGWSVLQEEMPKQVSNDGVDFEGSTAYHRLVLELFFYPALYRRACGLPVPDWYSRRLEAMARFVDAYVDVDGQAPLLGDADDGRTLPLGYQDINDHRYLIGLVGLFLGKEELLRRARGPQGEMVWLFGPETSSLTDFSSTQPTSSSQAFKDAGYYVMKNSRDRVFIDCAPVGLGDRGGHGHNDCLSFEAVLGGTKVVSDCGSYVYTASPRDRNEFRSTRSHNTPQVDGEEINRFVHPDYLWSLLPDAQPQVTGWTSGREMDEFVGSHTGYRRLSEPVSPVRAIRLDHASSTLQVEDLVKGVGRHRVSVPIQLSPGSQVDEIVENTVRLEVRGKGFTLSWTSSLGWELTVEEGRVSPSYGVVSCAPRLHFQCFESLPVSLTLSLTPGAASESGRTDPKPVS